MFPDKKMYGELAAMLCAVSVVCVLLWIWVGDGRFGWTALVTAIAMLVMLGLSNPTEKPNA